MTKNQSSLEQEIIYDHKFRYDQDKLNLNRIELLDSFLDKDRSELLFKIMDTAYEYNAVIVELKFKILNDECTKNVIHHSLKNTVHAAQKLNSCITRLYAHFDGHSEQIHQSKVLRDALVDSNHVLYTLIEVDVQNCNFKKQGFIVELTNTEIAIAETLEVYAESLKHYFIEERIKQLEEGA